MSAIETTVEANMEQNSEMSDQPIHVCPWWMGYLLLNPIRRWLESPDKILAPLVEPGMTVLDPGCAMGFFSLPAARMVGEQGKVICVDMQPRMLRTLERRARRKGLDERIETIECTPVDMGIDPYDGQVDLALAIHMVHEVPRRLEFLRQLRRALKPGGKLLVMEPSGHVDQADFQRTLRLAGEAGFEEVELPFRAPSRDHAALFQS